MMCADHQGAAQNMAGIDDVVLAVGSSRGAARPNGPQRERDCGSMMEEMSKQHQAKAGSSGAQSLIALKTATSGSDGGGVAAQLPGTEGAKWEPDDSDGREYTGG